MLMSGTSEKKFMIASLNNGYFLHMHFGFDCKSFYVVGSCIFDVNSTDFLGDGI
jgi:hypothetical protein